MKKLVKLLYPDKYYASIFEIELEKLKKEGIVGIIVDLDNTLIAWNERETPEALHKWLNVVKDYGFRLCIVSNSTTVRAMDVAKNVGLPLIAKAWKPRAKAFIKAMAKLATSRSETAVIGDQIFTDVLGGNKLGLKTILVVPVSKKEMWTTRIIRKLERKILSNIKQRNIQKTSN